MDQIAGMALTTKHDLEILGRPAVAPEVTKAEPKTAVTVTAPAPTLTSKEQLLLRARKHGKHETTVCMAFDYYADSVLDKESLKQNK